MNLTATQRTRMRSFVHALRTTRRKQGTGMLHYIDQDVNGKKQHRYCCLGIACEVAIKDGLNLEKVKIGGVDRDASIGYQAPANNNYAYSTSVLPEVVQQWYGVNALDPDLNVRDLPKAKGHSYEFARGWATASSLNDSGGWTFKQIADAFEQTFLPGDWKKTQDARKKRSK
jgi:hypothetical protein